MLNVADSVEKLFDALHNIYRRIVQVHWFRPVEKHILTLYQLNMLQTVDWTEESETFVNFVIRRERASGKMQTNFFFRPVLRDIKVKLPNSMTQISFDGLVKLNWKKEFFFYRRDEILSETSWPSQTQISLNVRDVFACDLMRLHFNFCL